MSSSGPIGSPYHTKGSGANQEIERGPETPTESVDGDTTKVYSFFRPTSPSSVSVSLPSSKMCRVGERWRVAVWCPGVTRPRVKTHKGPFTDFDKWSPPPGSDRSGRSRKGPSSGTSYKETLSGDGLYPSILLLFHFEMV